MSLLLTLSKAPLGIFPVISPVCHFGIVETPKSTVVLTLCNVEFVGLHAAYKWQQTQEAFVTDHAHVVTFCQIQLCMYIKLWLNATFLDDLALKQEISPRIIRNMYIYRNDMTSSEK